MCYFKVLSFFNQNTIKQSFPSILPSSIDFFKLLLQFVFYAIFVWFET